MEQRAVIKFHAKSGKSASETFRMMQQKYGDACLSRSNVFIWHKRFVDGRESLEDEIKEGRPISVRTSEAIQKVRDFITENRNASVKMMEKALNINRETIRLILQEDLGKTKVCARLVIDDIPKSKTKKKDSTRLGSSGRRRGIRGGRGGRGRSRGGGGRR